LHEIWGDVAAGKPYNRQRKLQFGRLLEGLEEHRRRLVPAAKLADLFAPADVVFGREHVTPDDPGPVKSRRE
jgi:hypothetical protein